MKRIFYFDCHISVIREFEFILNELYESYCFEGWLISGHTHLIDKKKNFVEIINEDT
jgi:hypothetical protein